MITLKEQQNHNSMPIFGCSQSVLNKEPIHLPPICSLLDYIDETVGEMKRERVNSSCNSDDSDEDVYY
jgi:hypothetical protein